MDGVELVPGVAAAATGLVFGLFSFFGFLLLSFLLDAGTGAAGC